MYGSASDADLLSGRWYEIGTSRDLRRCECPSFYPLPAATPGFEAAYAAAAAAGAALPTHVHKTSCGGDWWQLGTYSGAAVRELGNFTALFNIPRGGRRAEPARKPMTSILFTLGR